ncbi:hypothetical protein [Hoyosella subflava]|uniref:Uncharacterized protein n=1 Tax=Hoyosella subflava (strain DSM 45089 / JCM 17490 / NBRC 109087 / DQS3-9A1) TaxID=443218 RepID=F6ES98_HOYSD|nr:hypothetical protein [Hoyosella subflava]AEF43019.1 hypothetical protein AS9A_P10002 [Hoyosella subflava DQS3-9A1]
MSDVVRDLRVKRYFVYRFTADLHGTPERFGCTVSSEGRADIQARNLTAASSMTFSGEDAPAEPMQVSVILRDGKLFQRFDQDGSGDWIELADTGSGWLNELLPLRLLEFADSEKPLTGDGVTIVGVPVARIPGETFTAMQGETNSATASLLDPSGTVRISVTCADGSLTVCDVSIPCTDGNEDRMRIELAPARKFEVMPPAGACQQFSNIEDFTQTASQEMGTEEQ